MTEILSIGGVVSPLNVRNSAQPVSVPEVSGNVQNESFISSRIRVDNLLDLAILEYRSQEGDVIRQFPTQGQIQAFQRAAELDRRTTTTPEDSGFTPVNTNNGTTTPSQKSGATGFTQDTSAPSSSAPAPQSAAPAPLTASNVTSFVSTPASNATTPSTTQSVVV